VAALLLQAFLLLTLLLPEMHLGHFVKLAEHLFKVESAMVGPPLRVSVMKPASSSSSLRFSRVLPIPCTGSRTFLGERTADDGYLLSLPSLEGEDGEVSQHPVDDWQLHCVPAREAVAALGETNRDSTSPPS
jgi:hypothetical protein